MRLTKADLKPVVIEDLGTKTLMVPNDEGRLELKECGIMSFGLAEGYVQRLTLERDRVSVKCPTNPRTDCETMIEFDAGELEEMFKERTAFQTACPGCRRPLGLIQGPDRTFFFGWLP